MTRHVGSILGARGEQSPPSENAVSCLRLCEMGRLGCLSESIQVFFVYNIRPQMQPHVRCTMHDRPFRWQVRWPSQMAGSPFHAQTLTG